NPSACQDCRNPVNLIGFSARAASARLHPMPTGAIGTLAIGGKVYLGSRDAERQRSGARARETASGPRNRKRAAKPQAGLETANGPPNRKPAANTKACREA